MLPTEGDDVRISDSDHPHHGATGTVEGDKQSIYVAGRRMVMIDFHRKHHGKRGCYASPNQIEPE